MLTSAFVPWKLSAGSGLVFGCMMLFLCNWAGVGKSWDSTLYADARPAVEC